MKMSPIIGQGNVGDFVHNSQPMAKDQGFSNVSAFWMPNTISYSEAMDKLEKERANRKDLLTNWKDWKFNCEGTEFFMEYADGRKFKPTEYCLMNLAKFSNTSLTHVKHTLGMSENFKPDDVDIAQLCNMMNYRKKSFDMKDKKPRQLLFRTYGDGTLRAVLTDEFTAIDNGWVLKLMSAIIPGGRISHQRGDADTMFGNILLPDNVREEDDGKYGGMITFRNSEIGCASLDTLPSLFRAICRNGNIWDSTKGTNYRKVHKGKINLKEVAIAIHANVTEQIRLIPELMDAFLAMRDIEFESSLPMPKVIAAVCQMNKLSPAEGLAIANQYKTYEKDSKTAFGVINAITRAGQLYDAEKCRDFDILGGRLVSANWNNIKALAKSMSMEAVASHLGMSV